MLPLRDRLPTRRFPIVNALLIAANVLVFIGERALLAAGIPPRAIVFEWGLVPANLVAAPFENASTVLTSMFTHDPSGFAHIGGNMLFLWIFGDNVEDALGRGRYLGFYLLSGLVAAGAQVIIDPSSPAPMVGASGAIAGVLAAYGSLYPRSPITVLNPIPLLWLFFGFFIELPAWLIILEFFLVNLISGLGLSTSASVGVAFFAHLGGFVAGLFLVRVFLPEAPPRDHDRWDGFRPSRRPRSHAPPNRRWDEPPHR
jgi:membrane associated rhomboid family serine protease